MIGSHGQPDEDILPMERAGIRLPLAALAVVWLLLTGGTRCQAAAKAAARDGDCPMVGATYQPNVHVSGWDAAHLSYRLKIDSSPPAVGPARPADLWRFQVFDRHTKALLSELRLTETCPGGRAPCSIGTRARQDDGTLVTDPYSDVITLNERFMRSTDVAAPYAILLPGFIGRGWDYGHEDVRLGYLTSAGSPMFSSFPSFIVWGRVSCGHT